MKKSIKNTGLMYKANPVKKLQQGGLTMGYGYKDPNKDMYKNIGDSSLYKEGVKPANFANPSFVNKRTARRGGYYGNSFDPNNIKPNTTAPVNPTKTVKDPPNLSMGNGLMYSKTGYNVDNGAIAPKTPDLAAENPLPDVDRSPSMSSSISGATSLAGTANAVAQPALALLNDKDPYTYTDKEKVGTATSSVVAGAASGVALAGTAFAVAPAIGTLAVSMGLGAAAGSAVPVLGTIVGAVVGLGLGIWKMRKNKKEAEKNVGVRDHSIDINEAANKKKRLVARDANVAASAGSTFGRTLRQSNSQEGVPGGYLTRGR